MRVGWLLLLLVERLVVAAVRLAAAFGSSLVVLVGEPVRAR